MTESTLYWGALAAFVLLAVLPALGCLIMRQPLRPAGLLLSAAAAWTCLALLGLGCYAGASSLDLGDAPTIWLGLLALWVLVELSLLALLLPPLLHRLGGLEPQPAQQIGLASALLLPLCLGLLLFIQNRYEAQSSLDAYWAEQPADLGADFDAVQQRYGLPLPEGFLRPGPDGIRPGSFDYMAEAACRGTLMHEHSRGFSSDSPLVKLSWRELAGRAVRDCAAGLQRAGYTLQLGYGQELPTDMDGAVVYYSQPVLLGLRADAAVLYVLTPDPRPFASAPMLEVSLFTAQPQVSAEWLTRDYRLQPWQDGLSADALLGIRAPDAQGR